MCPKYFLPQKTCKHRINIAQKKQVTSFPKLENFKIENKNAQYLENEKFSGPNYDLQNDQCEILVRIGKLRFWSKTISQAEG